MDRHRSEGFRQSDICRQEIAGMFTFSQFQDTQNFDKHSSAPTFQSPLAENSCWFLYGTGSFFSLASVFGAVIGVALSKIS